MITNNSLTVYHKGLDETTHYEIWTRFNYNNIWFFGKENSTTNKGYDQANNVEVRIPYDQNVGLDVKDFSIGDILVAGTLDLDIETQQDLSDYLIYNIISISDNNFGGTPHIHLRGE